MFTYVPAQDELSSNVIGLDVYNEDKQNIGTIKDIALDANGLNGYIVNVGGFLGMGDHYVVVRPSAISFNAKDNKWHATMNVNADQLKAAPEYKYSSAPCVDGSELARKIFTFASLVGAAMCSASECGSHDRWP